MKIINIKPKTRKKGFDKSNFTFSDVKNKIDDELLNKLNILKRKIINYNLNSNEKKIINKILKSYEKISSNLKLKEDDMVLENQELLEFKKISEKNYARYLIYRYKYNIYPKIKVIDEFPPCVQIEPTSICNFRCVMCYQADKTFSSKSKGFMGHMNIDLFKKCIDQLEGKVEALTFASRGEPTLSKSFKEMIKYTNDKFLGLKINTNASMLNEEMIHLLLSSDKRSFSEYFEEEHSIKLYDAMTFKEILTLCRDYNVGGRFK